MMSSENGILLVEALYSFKGKNNDELCFRKGDIITVTQREEGGWWEGTLDDKTGWFPSNYTKEYKPPDGGSISPLRGESDLISPQHSQQQQIYRNLVLKDILDSERAHVADLQNLHATHLTALHKSEVLSEAEYKQLVGNLEEVISTHTNLVTCLEEQNERPSRDQRIGRAFLTMAPQLQGVHKTYCTNHPRAVCMLEKYKDELNSFMECQGAVKPGIMVLTTALSKPFRRLDKYAGMLQEYERHLDEGHPDRGDTQRSSHVYKELASTCGAIRRQKELELEVVTGRVHGWDGGDSLGTLGDVMRMGSVALLPDHRDRYLVLFPATLVMLSVSPRMSAFIFEGSYPLSSVHVTKLEDGDHHKNAFEISGPMAERIVAVCQTREDQLIWVETLTQQCRMARASNFTPHKPSLTSPPVPPAHVSVASNNYSHLQPSMPELYTCMSCGLLWNPSGECGIGVEMNGGPTENPYTSSYQDKFCQCRASNATNTSSTFATHQNSVSFPSETFYVSRPYAILTKYFSNMYRRKIITRKLLRYLAGDKENEEVLHLVQLRRHRTECTIMTGDVSSDDSDDEPSTLKLRDNQCSDVESTTSGSSSDDGYWVGEDPRDKAGIFSPLPKKKEYPQVKISTVSSTASSSLQKWRFQPGASDKRFMNSSISSSGESGVSTDGSNPYGYVRYFNPDDSSLGSPQLEGDYSQGSTQRFTYTKPYSTSYEDFEPYMKMDKSSSCEDPYYSTSQSIIPLAATNVMGENDNNQNLKCPVIEGEVLLRQSYPQCFASTNITEGQNTFGVCTNEGLTVTRSIPLIAEKAAPEKFITNKTLHSSTLNIPATTIILPHVGTADSDGEFSDSTPNICNRTIYESSMSSEDVPVIENQAEEPVKKFPFKIKPDIAYYMSSCSGDEMGDDKSDFYENQRNQKSLALSLSRSEPNLLQRLPSIQESEKPHTYSSHFVQFVHNVEHPSKVCNCESHSHRSSDSGLADVLHHLECCPLRSETPGLGRGSSISRCSHSSQFSNLKAPRSISSCQIRPVTPDHGVDSDSLLLSPMLTPRTSVPVTYAMDSFNSFPESVTLHHSTSAQELLCTTFSESNNDESVFRSGLYAHWWMKASVCPKVLQLDKSKKDYLRFRVDKKPEVPPKPKFLKPSYHTRRGGAFMRPAARSAATQTNFGNINTLATLHSAIPLSNTMQFESTGSRESQGQTVQSVRPKQKVSSTHLSPQSSVSISRDRSFESQASQISQVTVIPRLASQRDATFSDVQIDQLTLPPSNLSASKRQSKNSQGSSGTSGNSCTELASLHSFSESCERDGDPPHIRDSSEGLDVDFHRRASSHSLHVGVGPSEAFVSSLYCQLQPFSQISSCQHSEIQKQIPSASASGCTGEVDDTGKPRLPPKPSHLQSWPIQRSKSLPKLPLSSISIHSQSKEYSS